MDTKTFEDLEIVFNKTDKIIEEYIGKRCPEFEFSCVACKFNAIYEEFKIKMAEAVENEI